MPDSSWPVIVVHAARPAPAGAPIVVGVPFPAGQVRDANGLRLHGPSGAAVPCACRLLVAWPDGSVRWALVAFSAVEHGPHRLAPAGASQAAPAVANPVRLARQSPQHWQLGNGLIELTLAGAGPGPISGLSALGQSVIARAQDLRFCVDQADTTAEKERTFTVLEESPIRTRVRIAGAHFDGQGKRHLSYRLDVELWAGSPALRLDYHFFNLESGQEHLPIGRIALSCRLNLGSSAQRHFLQENHGEFYEPRVVLNPAPVAIVTDTERAGAHVEEAAMLLDEVQYAPYLDAPLVNSDDWLGVHDGQRGVYLHMQDLAAMQPKRIFSSDNELGLEIWPPRAGELRLQQGRSRRQVITLSFHTGSTLADPAAISAAASVPLWEERATVAPAWLAHCKEFEQEHLLPYGKHARMEKFLSRIMVLRTPCDMFDLGDTPDSGYQRSYPTLGLQRQPRIAGAPVMPRVFSAEGSGMAPWCNTQFYEPVWTNNEYDAMHSFACELMRTGNAGYWRTLRYVARHNIEVDFYHYHDQKWLHRISPVHSAFHGSSGGYPSHFWTQGLLEYYCLSGDPDALEVAVALGDAILRFFHDPERGRFYLGFNRERGWALLALVHLYDITREQRFATEIDKQLEFFLNYHPGNDPEASIFGPQHLRSFYFMLNTIEAADLYQKITGRQDVADWLIVEFRKMPAIIRKHFFDGASAHSTAAAMAIAYERTGEIAFLKTGLICLDEMTNDDPRWLNPVPEIKNLAVVHRAFYRFLGHAYRTGLLAAYEYPSLRE